jgi:hypothetical protein
VTCNGAHAILNAALYKDMMANTARPTAGEPEPPASTCFSKVDSSAVQTMKHTSMQAVEVRNIVRRLNLLTRREKVKDVTRFQIVRMPLMSVCVSCEVMPIESRMSVK